MIWYYHYLSKFLLRYLINPPVVDFILSMVSSRPSLSFAVNSLVAYIEKIILSSSQALPWAIFKNLKNSLFVCRPKPSAILFEID